MGELITLTTDFGTRDSYVAELKGVLLSEGPPGLALVDLSHELPPFDVHAAALFLRSAVARFPPRTIHLAIVDPGVGSERRALIVKLGEQTLVGPDNSLFGYLFDGSEEVYVIDPERLDDRPRSSTFHGRDLFAPVAAALARGEPAERFGAPAEGYERMPFPLVEVSGNFLHGRVIHIDRFGNLITNVSEVILRGFLGESRAAGMCLYVGEHAVRARVDHYAQGKRGELVALIGSSGLVEVAAREASAALQLGVEVGRTIRVQRTP
jgi:S-adenosyl-L-methionine hydrolase (adenosine-forming)